MYDYGGGAMLMSNHVCVWCYRIQADCTARVSDTVTVFKKMKTMH